MSTLILKILQISMILFLNPKLGTKIFGVFIPPENYSYFNDEIFEKFENEIHEFSKSGYILLLGDFNACTGRDGDFISKDGHNFITNVIPHNLSKRTIMVSYFQKHHYQIWLIFILQQIRKN